MELRVSIPIHVVGVSHKTASIEQRERFSLSREQLSPALERIKLIGGCSEAAIVSTCNRSELLFVSEADSVEQLSQELIRSVWPTFVSNDRKIVYEFHGRDAVRHVFRVATGLDSMLLGEPQIFGQLKDAYEAAQSVQTTGPILHRLFQRSFFSAKLARTQTGLGRLPVSVAYAARELAVQIFEDLSNTTVLMIGAGATAELVLKYLTSSGANRVYIANRSLESAVERAARFDAIPIALNQLDAVLPLADIVIGCAALPDKQSALVTQAMVSAAQRERKGRTQFLIDLGVPRNFEAACGDLSDTVLYDVDDLERVVQSNLDEREIAARAAEEILSGEVEKFARWFSGRESEEILSNVMMQIRELERNELQRTFRQLLKGEFTPEQHELLQRALPVLCRSLTQKILHEPITQLKRGAEGEIDWSEFLKKLFGDQK